MVLRKSVVIAAVTAAVVVGAVVILIRKGEPTIAPDSPPSATVAQPATQSSEATPPAAQPVAIEKASESENFSVAAAAMQQSAKAGKHLFLVVYDTENEATRTVKTLAEASATKMSEVAQFAAISATSPAEKSIIDKCGLRSAPFPLILVIAPNGAITAGLTGPRVTETNLQNAIASPGMQSCLKALQDKKLVFLAVQNKSTKANDAAMTGVNAFKEDDRFAKFTEVIQIDPTDDNELEFLMKLQVNVMSDEAITVFLAPPGSIVGNYTGATDKDALVKALMAAASSCGPSGCGPSGCK
jgi:hypothetical protein